MWGLKPPDAMFATGRRNRASIDVHRDCAMLKCSTSVVEQIPLSLNVLGSILSSDQVYVERLNVQSIRMSY